MPVLWWRSVGHSHMAFSKEVIVDELAEAAGKDPIAFRLVDAREEPARRRRAEARGREGGLG